MLCNKCNTEISTNAKFCPNCGNQLKEEPSMKADDIDRNWLANVMSNSGYKREKDKEDDHSVFGTHAELHNLNISINKEQRLFIFSSLFVMKKSKFASKDQYFALNKANGSGNITTWFFTEESELLGVYSYLPFIDGLKEKDFVFIINKLNAEISNGLNVSGILKFSK